MRILTCLVFALTVTAGWLSYSASGAFAEVVKLAYAYLALMSVVCAMIVLTMKPEPSLAVSSRERESASSRATE